MKPTLMNLAPWLRAAVAFLAIASAAGSAAALEPDVLFAKLSDSVWAPSTRRSALCAPAAPW